MADLNYLEEEEFDGVPNPLLIPDNTVVELQDYQPRVQDVGHRYNPLVRVVVTANREGDQMFLNENQNKAIVAFGGKMHVLLRAEEDRPSVVNAFKLVNLDVTQKLSTLAGLPSAPLTDRQNMSELV